MAGPPYSWTAMFALAGPIWQGQAIPRSSTTMVSISTSGSYIQRVRAPATIAPRIGASQNNQSWPTYSAPANNAGPVLRAGLTEVLVTGIDTRWISVSARPMGIPANPLAAPLDVVPMMMNRKKKLITSSVTRHAVSEYLPGLSAP